MTTIARSVYASVAHRYWRPDWSLAKNREIYGRDASVEGLGANMRIELEADADLCKEPELSARLDQLKSLLDHQCVFLPGSKFEREPSTLENITAYLVENLNFAESSLSVWESEHLGCRQEGLLQTLIFKQRNLTLEIEASRDPVSGLGISRRTVFDAVERLLVKLNGINDPDVQHWGKGIYTLLKADLKGLHSVRVDLGRHEGLIVQSPN